MIRILPQGPQGPVQQTVGGPTQRVEPMRDQTGQQIQQVGQGVQSFATGLTRLASTLEEDRLVAVSADFRNRLDDVVSKKLYGPDGFLSRVGANATPYERARVMAGIRAEGVKLLGGMESDAQRANLNAAMDQAMVEADGATLRHLATQTLRYKASSLEVSANRSLDKWVRGIGTEAGDTARLAMDDDVEVLGRTLGWDAGMVAAKKLELSTQGHRTIVEGLVAIQGGAKAAKGYIEQHHAEIDGETQGRLGRMIRGAGVAEESGQLAAAAYEQASKDIYGDRAALDESQLTPLERERGWARAAEIVQQQYSSGAIGVEIRDASLDRINADHRQQKALLAGAANASMDMATKWLAENPMASIQQLKAAMPDVYSTISGNGGEAQLREFARNNRFVTDDGVFALLLGKSDDYWRGLSEPEVIEKFRGQLDNGDLRTILSRRRQAIGDLDKNATLVLSTEQRILDSFFKARGIENTGETLSPGNKKLLGIYRQNLQKRIDAEGAEVKPGEGLQRVIDAALLDTARTSVGWGDPELPVVAMTKEEQDGAYLTVGGDDIDLSRIEAKVRETIMRNLRNAGEQATNREVVLEWLKLGQPKTLADIRE